MIQDSCRLLSVCSCAQTVMRTVWYNIVRVDRNCRQQAQSLDTSVCCVHHVGSSRRSVDLQRVRSHRHRWKQKLGDATGSLQRQWLS